MATVPDTNDTASTASETSAEAVKRIESLSEQLGNVRGAVSRVIIGLDEVVDETLITLLAGGHVLLIGVPGLGKTKLVETLSVVFGLDERRIQCTPDLMPADILGSEVLDDTDGKGRSFRFLPGPVFSQLLMADEINRASPRTQSALLQAMQERRVSVAGQYHDLPRPFHVLATQNPLEQEGTYPLPEAQLDRFLMQVNVTYPDMASERQILLDTTGAHEVEPEAAMTADQLLEAQRLIRHVPVADGVVDSILRLVRCGRPETSEIDEVREHVAWGPGPRASQALMLAVRARAVLDGRLAPSTEDVATLAAPVLRHRMALNFAARAEGVTLGAIISRMLAEAA